ncbi:hypothetical protein [Flavobacterium rhizosphaerae]|uniref:Uncharacterized protein n=1 Tax=Flavobacterium rhizosphaerae TaxID=3163298 RepID=A0ABW8YZC8_9FLAO
MFAGVDFIRPAGPSPAGAAAKGDIVTIIAAEDIAVWPLRDAKGVKMLGNFVLKEGARMYKFSQTTSKFNASTEVEGDEDAYTIKHKVDTEIPGDSLEVNEFLHAWMGINAIVIFDSCQDNFKKAYGTKCAPLQLKPTGQDNNEARKKMVSFEQVAKTTLQPGHYTGALIFAEPYTAATAAFAINSANGSHYVVPALDVTAAIAPTAMELTNGQIVTFIGSGGDDPATLTQGTAGVVEVLLASGTTWTALKNAVIHLQVFDAGDDKYLIELSRS